MRKRLYNEIGLGKVCPDKHRDQIKYLLETSGLNQAVAYCEKNNIDLRDAQSFCFNIVSLAFTSLILKEAKKIREGS